MNMTGNMPLSLTFVSILPLATSQPSSSGFTAGTTCLRSSSLAIFPASKREYTARHPSPPRMSVVFQHTHTVLDMINQLAVSCGVGLAGIVGGKATEQVRQLTEGDQRAQAMERLSGEIDSVRRRKELATNINRKDDDAIGSPREWSDVAVDKLSNVVVVEEDGNDDNSLPVLGGVSDELTRFDSILVDRHRISRTPPDEQRKRTQITKPTDFLLDEDDL